MLSYNLGLIFGSFGHCLHLNLLPSRNMTTLIEKKSNGTGNTSSQVIGQVFKKLLGIK